MATLDAAVEDDRESATEIMIRGRETLALIVSRMADDAEAIEKKLHDSGWPPAPNSTADVEPTSEPTPSLH